MVDQELRGAEARLLSQVIRDHGLGGLEGKARRAVQIGSRAGGTDHSWLPAHTRADDELVLGGQELHDLAELAVQPFGAGAGGLLEKCVNVTGPEGEQAELRRELLLAQAVGEFVGRLRRPARVRSAALHPGSSSWPRFHCS
jgi:hypothetical protein